MKIYNMLYNIDLFYSSGAKIRHSVLICEIHTMYFYAYFIEIGKKYFSILLLCSTVQNYYTFNVFIISIS
jgi:hypothetical protein